MTVNAVLITTIYILLVILLSVAIILGIKMIITMEKINRIVDNVEDKVNSLNYLFDIIDSASGSLNAIYVKIADIFTSTAERLFFRKKGKKYEEE